MPAGSAEQSSGSTTPWNKWNAQKAEQPQHKESVPTPCGEDAPKVLEQQEPKQWDTWGTEVEKVAPAPPPAAKLISYEIPAPPIGPAPAPATKAVPHQGKAPPLVMEPPPTPPPQAVPQEEPTKLTPADFKEQK